MALISRCSLRADRPGKASSRSARYDRNRSVSRSPGSLGPYTGASRPRFRYLRTVLRSSPVCRAIALMPSPRRCNSKIITISLNPTTCAPFLWHQRQTGECSSSRFEEITYSTHSPETFEIDRAHPLSSGMVPVPPNRHLLLIRLAYRLGWNDERAVPEGAPAARRTAA